MTEPATAAPDEPSRSSRRLAVEAVVVGLLVIAGHLLFRLSREFLIGALNDDAVYVVLGKAIAQGDGYRSIHLVGAPLQVRYPPALPLLLAVPWALVGTLGAVRATVAVLHPIVSGAAAGLVWWVGRDRLELSPAPLALCAVAPFLLDPLIQYFNIPLTEPYLVLGWAGALAIAPPLFAPATLSDARPGRAVALGLVLAATALFRTAAVALVPAVLLALALHRRWKEAAACAAAVLVPLGAWQGLQLYWSARGPLSSQPDDLSYGRWLGVTGPVALSGYAVRTIAANVVVYVHRMAAYLFSSQPIGVVVVLAAVVAVAVACVRLRWSQTALVLTTLSVTALTLMWPFTQGRLLLPLLPFLGLLAASTVDVAARRAPPRWRWGVPLALGVAALAVTLRQAELREAASRSFRTGVLPPPEDLSPTLILAVQTRHIHLLAGWLRTHTTPADRLMVDAPAGTYLYTGRRTVPGSPTESGLGPATFAVPGRYVAGRILADSVTIVALSPPAPGLEQDIATIRARCPRVLEPEPAEAAVFFRVQRDDRCLREGFGEHDAS